jgi:hypothetical protein
MNEFDEVRSVSARLKAAAYAGILSLLLIPPEIFLEESLRANPGTLWIFASISLIYILNVALAVVFYRGFILIGRRLDHSSIVVGSMIIILLNFAWYGFQVYALRGPVSFYGVYGGVVLVVFGASRLLFGHGIYRARDTLGGLAMPIAILELVIGLFLMSVRFYLVGFVLSLVAVVLQIMLLLRLASAEGSWLQEGRSGARRSVPPANRGMN